MRRKIMELTDPKTFGIKLIKIKGGKSERDSIRKSKKKENCL